MRGAAVSFFAFCLFAGGRPDREFSRSDQTRSDACRSLLLQASLCSSLGADGSAGSVTTDRFHHGDATLSSRRGFDRAMV